MFIEANLALVAGHKLLLSGRADENTYSDWVFSPRLAWIWTLTEGHVLKLIAQRASRMNTASQMYANDRHDLHNTIRQRGKLREHDRLVIVA